MKPINQKLLTIQIQIPTNDNKIDAKVADLQPKEQSIKYVENLRSSNLKSSPNNSTQKSSSSEIIPKRLSPTSKDQ